MDTLWDMVKDIPHLPTVTQPDFVMQYGHKHELTGTLHDIVQLPKLMNRIFYKNEPWSYVIQEIIFRKVLKSKPLVKMMTTLQDYHNAMVRELEYVKKMHVEKQSIVDYIRTLPPTSEEW